MKKVKIEELGVEKFMAFGTYADMVNPCGEKIGASPITFYRDMVQGDFGNCSSSVSFSVCKVEKRPLVVDVSEYHSSCAEGCMALDNDMLIHVASATPAGASFPADKARIFRVPQGTMVVIRPGVWHHAPFTPDNRPVNTLVVLPERTYANDCVVKELAKPDMLQIVQS
jgi:ureidoglycolate lyase